MKNKLLKRANSGFSLVELIVVIAIMAILVGVAVPVYSSYIEKSEISKDKQMVDEVAHALQVYQASNFGETANGFVVLSNGEAVASDGFAAEAMESAFGANWEKDLALEYDNWVIDVALLNAALNSNGGALVDSSYMNNSSTSELLGNVQTVTNAAAGLLATVSKDPSSYVNSLKNNLHSSYIDSAVAAGIMQSDGNGGYTIVGATTDANGNIVLNADQQAQLSNLMLLSVAEEMKGISQEDMVLLMVGSANQTSQPYSAATQMAAQYAMYKAIALKTGKTQEFNDMNESLGTASGLKDVQSAFATFGSALTQEDLYGYALDSNNMPSDTLKNDASALIALMNGVSAVSPNYSDAETLKNSGLYTSDTVSKELETYVSAASVTAALNEAQIQQIKAMNLTKGVIVVIGNTGLVGILGAAD